MTGFMVVTLLSILLQLFACEAFVTCSQRQRSNTYLQLAAKKKKKSSSKQRQSAAAVGKGFGKASSVAIIVSPEQEKQQQQQQTAPTLSAYTDSTTHAILIEWLLQNPTTFISPKFTIKESDLGGYGGFSSQDFQDGELIFRIPRVCCVTSDDALSDETVGEIFCLAKQKRVPSYEMLIICGFIAKEYLLSKRIKGDKRSSEIKHWAYLQSIPWKQGELGQDHVIYWSEEKIERLLGGSLAYNDAMLIRKTVDSAIKLLKDVIKPTIQDTNDEEIEAAVKASFVICLSRSFAEEVESDNGAIGIENALLPLLDVLQHSNNPNTSLESYDDYILLRAKGDISGGEELYHCYQEERGDVIPPHKFFTRYGFIPGVRSPVEELLESKSAMFFPKAE